MNGDRDERKRELDEIFGDVLPETTADEREPASERAAELEWYERNRPPHHDRER